MCGSREWDDRAMVGVVLRGLLDKHGDALHLIGGEARGADCMARQFAEQFGVEFSGYPAKWDDYAPKDRWRAGHDRNQRMLDEGKPDLVVAFKDGLDPKLTSGGTENMIKIAQKADVLVWAFSHPRLIYCSQGMLL